MEPVSDLNGAMTKPAEQGMESMPTLSNTRLGDGLRTDTRQHSPLKHSCNKCLYSTRNKVLFDIHFCDSQGDEKEMEEKTLITLTSQNSRYHCSECDLWAQKDAFEEHLMCHVLLRPYQCLYCSLCFVNRREVVRHVAKEHKGKKMNCTLKALKSAKALIKAVQETGKFEFYSCVAGKVPLTSDPFQDKNNAGKPKQAAETLSESSNISKSDEWKSSTSDGEVCKNGLNETDSDQNKSVEEKNGSDICQGDDNDSKELPDVKNRGYPVDSSESTKCVGGETSCPAQLQNKNDDTTNLTDSTEIIASGKSADCLGENADVIGSGETSKQVNDEAALSEKREDVTADLSAITAADPKPSEIPEEMEADEMTHATDGVSKAMKEATGSSVADLAEGAEKSVSSDANDCVDDPVKSTDKVGASECVVQRADESKEPSGEEDSQAKDDITDGDQTEKGKSFSEENVEDMEVDNAGVEGGPEANAECWEDKTSRSPPSSASPVTDRAEDKVNDGDCSEETDRGFQMSNFEQTEEEESGMGFKIIAAFSLQEGNSNDSEKGNDKESYVGKSVSGTESCEPNGTSEKTSESAIVNSAGLTTPSHFPPTLGPPSKPVPSFSFLEPSPFGDTNSESRSSSHKPQESFNFFVCGFNCSFSSLTSVEFRDHLMLDHPGKSLFRCAYCGFQSSCHDGLISHLCDHSHIYTMSAPLYMCGASACKFGSNVLADFVSHQSCHVDHPALYCHECNDQFASIDEILKHFDANFLHIINCPHCTAKATDRTTLLNHITSAHPGKPKMVSSAKQIICRDRKLNGFARLNQVNSDMSGITNSRNRSLVSILKEPILPEERELTKQAAAAHMNYEISEDEEDDDCFDDSFEEEEYNPNVSAGSEMATPPEIRERNNFKCHFCTFIARDLSRLEGHERCHGVPPSRKSRFKCMFCPQSFNNIHKFSSHISCHPGLIKFTMYSCRHCDYDSNQKHVIVKHLNNTRDKNHTSYGSCADDMISACNKTMESRVLECRQCSYMTRHRKHLLAHLKREHSSYRKGGGTVNYNLGNSPKESLESNSAGTAEETIVQNFSSYPNTGNDGNVRENQARRFKCPICQYLVPRAADLKAHVKRHSEIGEITIVMFRCKYCSAASTAREIVYGHLMEKHLGKQIALVKKTVKIDTRGDDNGYAVSSVDDAREKDDTSSSGPSCKMGKTVLLIPDNVGENSTTQIECPACPFASCSRQVIIQHVSSQHPDVSVMGRRPNNEIYSLESGESSPNVHMTLGESLQGEVLIVPDSHTFEEAVMCPKCDFSSGNRKEIVQHLDQNHPEMSVMGRNDYPTIDSKGKQAVEANATGRDGMVIIGSGSLDEKIRCLYENFGDHMKCMICQAERPKKFFMHVHILRHLNILLWGCQYCSHKGLQKYKMMDHIKKVHPRMAFCIRYLPVNVEERVNDYLQNASMIRARRTGEETDAASPRTSLSGSMEFNSSDNDLNSLRMKFKASQDSLSSCTIGSEELDMKLACLYSTGEDNRFHCVVCSQIFMRKFAVHRHIVQIHLNVNLIGCGYCDLESVEKYIITDHILETHKASPISMRNLAQNLENKVADFLSQMTLATDAALDEVPPADLSMDDEVKFKLPNPPKTPTLLSNYGRASLQHTSPASSTNSGKNRLKPSLLLLGKDSLNDHLEPMFKVLHGPVLKFRCLVCRGVFDRKYAIHRHLLMKHLKKGIIGCPYCSFEGVERYQVFTHIKEDHKGAELRMVHLSVDLPSIVSNFMENLANGTLDLNSKIPPPWSMKRVPKKDEEIAASSPQGVDSHGLLVALSESLKSTIKKEPVDEDDVYGQEPMDREMNGYVDGDNNDPESWVGTEGEEREVQAMSLQSTNGSKYKLATDVQTDIRVITIKERGFKRHMCEKCKFTSLHRSNIVRHIYRVHEQYREQECPACNYKTLSRVLIEQHMQSEHPGVPFPRSFSNKAVKRKFDYSQEDQDYYSPKKNKTELIDSQQDRTPSSPNGSSMQLYACAYCTFETMTHSDIVQHTKEKHSLAEPMKGEDDDLQEMSAGADSKDQEMEDTEFESLVNTVKMNQIDLSSGSEDALWQCFYCSYKTSSEEDLKIHFANNHPGNVYRSKKIPTWRFVCRSCHVKTRAHSKMRYHLNRHINYRPYTCTTCGAFYPSPDQCRKHCRSNGHSETFTYVKVPSKEKRLQELIKECQQLAVALTKDPNEVDDSESPSVSYPVPSKRKARKSCVTSSGGMFSRMLKKYDDDPPYSPRKERSPRVQVDQSPKGDAQMKCANCDFIAQNVCDVWLHFIEAHDGEEFHWVDTSSGHICNEVGQISNAKEVPAMLEAPSGPGYTMQGNRTLSCHYCDFSTSTVQAMKSHLRCHLPKRYLCPYCSLRCSRRDTITQHVRCGHKGRELWTIFFCLPKDFEAGADGGSNADKSIDLEEPQVTFQVDEEQRHSSPSATASSPASAASPTNSERIQCARCDLKLDNVAAVLDHHNQEHTEMDFLWVDTTSGYTFNMLGEMMTDTGDHNPQLVLQDGFTAETGSGNVPTFYCKLCHFSSGFIQAIKSHMKSHLPHGFICPYCSVTANSKEKIVSHQSYMHRDRESWVVHLRMCSDSSAASTTSSAGEKNSSSRRQLRGATSYTCTTCDHISENLYQHRLHLARHTNNASHGGNNESKDVPLKCGYCAYVATDEGDYGAHIASHLERDSARQSQTSASCEADDDDAEEVDPQDVSTEYSKVQVLPDSDFDGSTLSSPPTHMGNHLEDEEMENEKMEVNEPESPNSAVGDAEIDYPSDTTEGDYASREGSPSRGQSPSPDGQSAADGGGSILRLTLQGNLTGQYGIKRAVPANASSPTAQDCLPAIMDQDADLCEIETGDSNSKNCLVVKLVDESEVASDFDDDKD